MKNRSSFLSSTAAFGFAACALFACTDTDGMKAEHYVRTDTAIQSAVGDVLTLSRTRTTMVRKGDRTNAYNEYQFIVRGSRGKALVNIRVTNIEHPSKRSYSVKSIDAID
jgi:hypothetical protein